MLEDLGKHAFKVPEWVFTETSSSISFSIAIFQWQLSSNKKSLKKSKTKVTVVGKAVDYEKVTDKAQLIKNQLDNNLYTGPKTVVVK